MARKQSARSQTGCTVLVIDDDREYLATTERLLARDGHHVIAMDDPAEALALLRHERVDLVHAQLGSHVDCEEVVASCPAGPM